MADRTEVALSLAAVLAGMVSDFVKRKKIRRGLAEVTKSPETYKNFQSARDKIDQRAEAARNRTAFPPKTALTRPEYVALDDTLDLGAKGGRAVKRALRALRKQGGRN